MPVYEFYCKNCNKRFSARLSLSDYEKKKYSCPNCKKNDAVRQEVTPFTTKTSRKS